MTKTLSMVSHKNYNLNANEGFVMFLASKLITCFIDGCTSKIKSRWIAHLLNGSEQIYWVSYLEGEVHSIWDLWISGLQECKGNGLFKVGWNGQKFSVGSRKSWFLFGRLPLPGSTSPEKLVGEVERVPNFMMLLPNCLYISTWEWLPSAWSIVAACNMYT